MNYNGNASLAWRTYKIQKSKHKSKQTVTCKPIILQPIIIVQLLSIRGETAFKHGRAQSTCFVQ